MKKIITSITAIILSLAACSCIKSYTVDGEGVDWAENPIQKLPSRRVKPNVSINLPNGMGQLDLEGVSVSPEK